MPKGFELNLQPYCSYCGEFEPEHYTAEITSMGDKQATYINTIYCSHSAFCEKMKEHLKAAVKEDDISE